MERRPNPPGWTQPKAPYNPYDVSDQRPPQGYPSEFQTPRRPRNWSFVPKEPTNYRNVQESMRRLNYTPRPPSDLYPGQYKVLRRRSQSGFTNGVRLMGKTATAGVLLGSVFFYRWNDGYENVFSAPYRWQLRMRQRLGFHLSEQQAEDLKGDRQQGMVPKVAPVTQPINDAISEDVALERPSRSHVIEAERIRQAREYAILRAVQIAESKVGSDERHHEIKTDGNSSGKSWWPWSRN